MDIPHSLTVSEQLLPRRYQEEIFVRAQEGNIIAALDTGSGKTFISTLLMKWVASNASNSSKLIVFLVPKVPLVEQQAEFIRRQTPLRVRWCHGAHAWDLADRGAWRRQFLSADVIVMTGISDVVLIGLKQQLNFDQRSSS
jgi:endoribonuclease Dicer